MREKCSYSQFFWSVYARIWTEQMDFRSKSPHSVHMRENADKKNYKYGRFLRSDRH